MSRVCWVYQLSLPLIDGALNYIKVDADNGFYLVNLSRDSNNLILKIKTIQNHICVGDMRIEMDMYTVNLLELKTHSSGISSKFAQFSLKYTFLIRVI